MNKLSSMRFREVFQPVPDRLKEVAIMNFSIDSSFSSSNGLTVLLVLLMIESVSSGTPRSCKLLAVLSKSFSCSGNKCFYVLIFSNDLLRFFSNFVITGGNCCTKSLLDDLKKRDALFDKTGRSALVS